MRKTKIIATIGPASSSVETLRLLVEAGLSAARINFSHGSHESHGETINKVKQVRDEMGRYIPLVLDTKGPEIRTKDFNKDKIQLTAGNKFTITTDDIIGDETKVAVTYADFAKDLKVGNRGRYKEKSRLAKRAVAVAKGRAWTEWSQNIDTAEEKQKMFKMAKQMKEERKDVIGARCVKDEHGYIKVEEADIMQRWERYFSELLNEESQYEVDDHLTPKGWLT